MKSIENKDFSVSNASKPKEHKKKKTTKIT